MKTRLLRILPVLTLLLLLFSLTVFAQPAEGLGIGFIKNDNTNVYAQGPDTPIIARLDMGTAVAVTANYGDWYQLGNADGDIVGYVAGENVLLKDFPKDETEAYLLSEGIARLNSDTHVYLGQDQDSAALGEELAAYAQEHLGKPYRWGAAGPSSFDCSGFVNYVYKQFGYSLERVANDIYNENGEWVDYTDLRAGDIICFTGTYSTYAPVTHVGIYIGDGQFVHASNRGVIISQLVDGEYYLEHYYGAKRILAAA